MSNNLMCQDTLPIETTYSYKNSFYYNNKYNLILCKNCFYNEKENICPGFNKQITIRHGLINWDRFNIIKNNYLCYYCTHTCVKIKNIT